MRVLVKVYINSLLYAENTSASYNHILHSIKTSGVVNKWIIIDIVTYSDAQLKTGLNWHVLESLLSLCVCVRVCVQWESLKSW